MLEKPVTLHVRSQPINEILSEISRQTGIQFAYSPQAVDVSRPASVDAHSLPVKEVLRQLMDGRYEYKAVRKFIILRKSRVEIYSRTHAEQQPPHAEQPPPHAEQQPPHAEKTSHSYITNQRYVKKLCYTDSGTTPDGCLSTTNNQNSETMKKYLAAVALASAAGVGAQAQQPATVSAQLGKAGKEFIALVREVTDSTGQAVKMAANEIGRQASSLKPFGMPADTPPPAASGDSVRPIAFTICYPFSFPELSTERYAYRTSITYLFGVNGGVSGAEVGGGVNVNRRYMSGVQLAGLSNLSLGSVTGVQLAGVLNLAAGDTAKAQLAGVANVAQSAVFQSAGIANVACRTANVQLAGVANAAQSANVQLAGIANTSAQGNTSVQLAGIANAAQSANVQLAGIANASAQGNTSVQLAGIANATDTSRCQVGLVNVSRKAGVQVGLVNVCDTSVGVMVGLVNVAARGGLYELEIGADPVDQLNLTYRMGTKKFYTLAEFSYRRRDRRWLGGAGMGAQISLPRRWSLNVEGASQHVITSKMWQRGSVNLLAQARVTAAKQLSNHLAVFAGPTVYVYCTKLTNPNSVDLSSPYHIFSYRGNHFDAKAWAGFLLGVRIN